MNIKEIISSVDVHPDDFLEAFKEMAEMPEERQSFEAFTILLAKKFRGQPDMSFAVSYRLRALTKLMDSIKVEELPYFMKDSTADDSVYLSEDLIKAAAVHPLEFPDGDEDFPYFDFESFKRRCFANTDTEGTC